jgi:hypothetical protein
MILLFHSFVSHLNAFFNSNWLLSLIFEPKGPPLNTTNIVLIFKHQLDSRENILDKFECHKSFDHLDWVQ